MRRRPPSCVGFPTKRALPPVSPALVSNPGSLALFLDRSSEGEGECTAGPGSRDSVKDDEEARCRALQNAIDQVTQKFEEAQQEYQSAAANSPDWHKWKGEMIAYANAVALLEDLKSRHALVR
jgi:hypothetical protein